MKSIIILLIGLCFATSASAQDDWHPYAKGTKLIGFSLTGQAQESETNGIKSDISAGILNGQFGYFLTNGFVLGIAVNTVVATIEQSNSFLGNITAESTESTIGLFAAYYFRLGAKSAIYPEIRVFGGVDETVFDSEFFGRNEVNADISGATFGLGYIYRINHNIGLDVKLRAGTQKNTVTDSSSENATEFSIGEFLVGFQIFF